MPKKGEFDHLKPKVFDLLKQGSKISEVRDRYPELPAGTVKTWAKKIRDELGFNVKTDNIQVLNPQLRETESTAQSVTCEVVSDASDRPASEKIVVLPTGAESDFALVRKQMRAILRDPTVKPYAKAIAGSLLLKAVEMRANLPASVLDEVQETTVHHERKALASKSAEELAQEYRELLG